MAVWAVTRSKAVSRLEGRAQQQAGLTVPEHDSLGFPWSSYLKVGAIGQVGAARPSALILQECYERYCSLEKVQNGIRLFGLETDDPPAELLVDKQGLFASDGVASY